MNTEEQINKLNELLEKQIVLQTKMANQLTAIEQRTRTTANLAAIPMYEDIYNVLKYKQMGFKETLQLLAENESMSFVRFGDGEFRLVTRFEDKIPMQDNSLELMAGLEKSFTDEDPNILVGINHFFQNVGWASNWASYWVTLKDKLESRSTRLADASVTRQDFFKFYKQEGVELWRNIWNDKNVVIITGENSRFELIPELFDGVKSTEFIYTKPTNAFSEIDNIIEEAKSKNPDMFLISLGPAGTVLAYEMAKQGKRALDIGHISSSYQNAFEGKPVAEKTPIVRK